MLLLSEGTHSEIAFWIRLKHSKFNLEMLIYRHSAHRPSASAAVNGVNGEEIVGAHVLFFWKEHTFITGSPTKLSFSQSKAQLPTQHFSRIIITCEGVESCVCITFYWSPWILCAAAQCPSVMSQSCAARGQTLWKYSVSFPGLENCLQFWSWSLYSAIATINEEGQNVKYCYWTIRSVF